MKTPPPRRFGIPRQIETEVKEYPVSEDRTYLRYSTRVWVDEGDDLWRAHFYVAWRYRQDGLLSNILHGFETPSEIVNEIDASIVMEDGEVMDPEEMPVPMDTEESLLARDSDDGEVMIESDPEEVPLPDISS
ncbi:C1_2 domain-containing protein [Psidium guajava]|nr:C1_2 domain-containing protein [Psidium guajava]